MLTEWLRNLILLLVPADDGEDADDDQEGQRGTETDDGGEAAGTGDGEGESGEDELAQLKSENARLKARHDAEIRAEAERLLDEVFPDGYGGEEPGGQTGRRQDDVLGDGDDELTLEERLARIEQRQIESEQDRNARQLVDYLNRRRSAAYPNADIGEVLQRIAAKPGADPEKVLALSHQRRTDILEQYHQSKIQDPDYRQTLLQELQSGGAPTEEGSPSGGEGRKPPRLPGRGATTTSAEPITRNNVKRIFAERLRNLAKRAG